MTPRRRWIALLLSSLALFLLMLGGAPVTSSHEARVGLVARAMAESGWPWNARHVTVPLFVDKGVAFTNIAELPHGRAADVNPWVVPVYMGQIRLQKPPLPYWCAAVLMRMLGPTEWALRLVPALLGVGAVFLLYDLARRLVGRRLAWYAAVAFLTTHFVVSEYRKAMADPYLAFFALFCLWAWVRAVTAGDRSAPPPRRPAASALLLFYTGMGLALLAKGPVVWVHLAIAIGLLHLCFRRSVPGPWWAHAAGLLVVLTISLPWPAAVARQVPGALEVWRYESVGELADNTNNARPWHYYLPMLPLLAVPWVGLWPLGVLAAVRRLRPVRQVPSGFPVITDALPSSGANGTSTVATTLAPQFHISTRRRAWRRLFPLAWYVVALVFFSVVNLKKNAYLLPMIPAQSMLMAQGAALLLAWGRRPHRRHAAGVVAVGQVVAGLAAAVLLAWHMTSSKAHLPLAWALPLSALALAAAQAPWRAAHRQHWQRWLAVQSLSYALLVALLVTAFDIPREARRGGPAFAATLAQLARQPGTALYPLLPPDLAFYVPADVPGYDPRAPRILVGIAERDPAAGERPPADFSHIGAQSPILSARRVARWPQTRFSIYEVQTGAIAPATSAER